MCRCDSEYLEPSRPSLGAIGLVYKPYDVLTYGLHLGSFLGLVFKILNINHKKELQWSLQVSRT